MAKQKLNVKKTFWIGFGFFASSIAWSVYNGYVPNMLESRYVPALVEFFGWPGSVLTVITGAIMTIDNIFGVVFQPLFGALSDKTRTPIGRRMPYITIGIPVSALLFMLIPLMGSLWTFMGIIIVFNFTMSTWRAPVVALMPDLTPPTLRSQANGVINLMGGIGSLLAFALGGFLIKLGGAPAPFFFSAAVMVLALVLLRLFVKEPAGAQAIEAKEEGEADKSIGDLPPAERRARTRSLILLLFAIFFWFNGYNAVEALFSLFAINVIGVDPAFAPTLLAFFSLTFIAMALPAGILGGKIGRKKTILIGLAGVTVLFPSMVFFPNFAVVAAMLLLGGCFWACVNINSLPMVLQLAAHRDIGKYTGYYYFFSFSAAISAPILAGLMRDLTKSYTSVFIYAGISFLIAFACMLLVRHGEVPAPAQSAGEILENME